MQSQLNQLLLLLLCTSTLFASSTNTRYLFPLSEKTVNSDTTYFKVNSNAIYSITDWEGILLKEYRQYFLNGSVEMKISFSSEGDSLIIGKYTDKDNKALGEIRYSSQIGGSQWIGTFYNEKNSRIYAVTYSYPQQQLEKIVNFTTGNKIREEKIYTYENDRIKTEIVKNRDNTIVSKKDWNWESNGVTYTQTFENNQTAIDNITGIEYDSYKQYYRNPDGVFHSKPDSTKYMLKGETVFIISYSYSQSGWETKRQYSNNKGEEHTTIEQQFNQSKNEILRLITQINEISQIRQLYDDKNRLTEATYYYQTLKMYTRQFQYNNDNLVSKVNKVDYNKKLLSYEKYLYYDQFNYLKQYTLYDPNDKKVQEINYNEFGDITKDLPIGKNPILSHKPISINHNGLTLFSLKEFNFRMNIYSANGKLLKSKYINIQKGKNNIPMKTFNLSKGVYLYRLILPSTTVSKRVVIH